MKRILKKIDWSASFLAHPDDIRVRGDEQHIIVALSIRVPEIYCASSTPIETFPLPRNWLEEPKADELSRIDRSTLIAQTSLKTNTNRVALARYELPGPDGLGAKYYFPRKLASGAPLIAAGDKELTFETRINKSKVRAKFDLKKMSYSGKPEI